jgi:hypothetical protein
MRIGLNLGLTNHSFDAQGLAEYPLRTAEPSQFNEEPISASVTGFDNYQNLLIAGTYALTFSVKTKAYFDIKVFIGVDLFYDGGAEITTYYDDYPYLQNMREEVYIESASSIAFYSGLGLGFRWKFNEKISAGISLDLAYANLSYPQNFTWESLDDTGTYDFNFGTIDLQSHLDQHQWRHLFHLRKGKMIGMGEERPLGRVAFCFLNCSRIFPDSAIPKQ